MKNFKDSWFIFLSIILVFISVSAFFVHVAPKVPWSSDDWRVLSTVHGHFLPMGDNNPSPEPSRVSPYMLGPVTGLIAAYIVYPLCGDYIFSIVFSIGMLMAMFTTVLYVFIYLLFESITKNKALSLCAALFMLLLYFAMFKTNNNGNTYMLWHHDIATIFVYWVPNIFNSIMILWLLRKRLTFGLSQKGIYSEATNSHNLSFSGMNYITAGILLCVLYLSMFSILWGAAILFAFAGYELFLAFVFGCLKKERFKLIDFFDKHWVNITIVIFFIGYVFSEYSGDRATHLRDAVSTPFNENLSICIGQFKEMFLSLDNKVMTISTAVVALYLYCFFSKKSNMEDEKDLVLKKLNYAIIFTAVATFALLCFSFITVARTEYYRHIRIEFFYGFFFFAILTILLCGLYVMSVKPKISFVFPIILLMFFSLATRASLPLSGGYFHGINAHTRIDIMRDFIEQIQEADKNGEAQVVYVPHFYRPDVSGHELAVALRAHSIIRRPIAIHYE